MGFLRKGIWHGGDQDQIGAQGWEPRHEQFVGQIRRNPDVGKGELEAEPGRFLLVVCPGCPLSHRTKIVHALKRLDGVVKLVEVRPVMGPNGREFGTADCMATDPATGVTALHQLYRETDPAYSGRDSTPVLWDSQHRRIVSNTYRDIFGMLNRDFDAFTSSTIDLRPTARAAEVEAELARLAGGLLGVVYRMGFSRQQNEFDEFAATLAKTVRQLAADLADKPFLLGDEVTEPDIALVVCLLRYDAIYLPLFGCTAERIEDHPALTSYIERMLALPGLRSTFDLGQTMRHYFLSHAHINPRRIVPPPPHLSWWRPGVSPSVAMGSEAA